MRAMHPLLGAFQIPAAARSRAVFTASILMWVGIALTLSPPTRADEIPLSLAAKAASTGGEVAIVVPDAGGSYEVTLLRKPSQEPLKIDLYATTFVAPRGDSISVKLALPHSPDIAPAATLKNVEVSGPVLTVAIQIPALPHDGPYTGNLIAAAAGKDAMVVKVTLNRPARDRSAILVVDPQTISAQLVRSLTGHGGVALALTLRDKTGQSPIEGMYAEVESVAKAPGGIFSNNNLSLTVDGSPLPFGAAAPVIPAGGHAALSLRLRDLSAGSYDAIVRFRAANSADDDAQKFHLMLEVRDGWGPALAAIIVALLLSFVGTKFIAFRRKSSELQQRILALDRSWLKAETSVPAVCARAILSQCDDLSRRLWLAGANVIEDRLTKVTALIEVLDNAHRLMNALAQIKQSAVVQIRAISALRRVIADMGDACSDDAVIASAKTTVQRFADWTQVDHIEAAYWTDLVPWITRLSSNIAIDSNSIPDAEARKTMDQLLADLRVALNATPAGMDAKVDIEKKYVYLKTLWERRAQIEFRDLARAIKNNAAYDDILKIADDAAWNRLKNLPDSARKLKSAQPGDLRAYAPLRFIVETDDQDLNKTVLFSHLLRFEWVITLPQRKTPLETPTTQPEIVQYSPSRGKMSVKVVIRRGTEKIELDKVDLEVQDSVDFSLMRGFEKTEIISFIVASLAAIASGLVTFWTKNTTFGSAQDYLAIMLWGLSVDQTKTAMLGYFGIAKS